MKTIGPVIADSARLSLGYGRRLLEGVTAEQFPRLAVVSDTIVDSNHPAFIYGHLSLYGCRVVEELGGDASAIVPPQSFVDVFSHEAKCVDDADANVYPAMDDIVKLFFNTYEAAIAAVEAAEDDQFTKPNPNEKMLAKFATVGSMHGFYLGGHIMIHMGQMSAWRRMVGLGPA